MGNIFISYNHQSETVVRSVVDDIEALGHTVWFDQELSGGQAWWDKILSRIRDCDIFVFVLDPTSLDSSACKSEYDYAGKLGKSILPVLVAEGVATSLLPPVLSRIQFLDYRKQDRKTALNLARAISNIPPSPPLPTPLPALPKAPISYLGTLTEQIESTNTLSYEDQSVLVVDLKRSFRDSETTEDTRTLLERLRKRHDLFATIAEEIDELLSIPRKVSPIPSRSSESPPEPQVLSEKIIKDSHSKKVDTKEPSYIKALGFHLLLGLGLFYVNNQLKRKWLYAFFPLYAIVIFILGPILGINIFEGNFGAVNFYGALSLWGLSFIDVSIICRSRRKHFQLYRH